MDGIELIAKERQRQIDEEGFTAEHDKNVFHQNGELAQAACYYAWPFVGVNGPVRYPDDFYPRSWHPSYAKRESKNHIRRLAVAGALIAAELDRLIALEKEGVK